MDISSKPRDPRSDDHSSVSSKTRAAASSAGRVAPADLLERGPLSAHGCPASQVPMPKSLLLMDDNAVARRLIRNLLATRFEGDICAEAADGVEAVEKARAVHPDIAILNIVMPRLNGVEAARRIVQSAGNSRAGHQRLRSKADSSPAGGSGRSRICLEIVNGLGTDT